MGRADLALICPLAPDAILIPKIARVEDIAAAERLLRDNAAPASLRLWIMIETPRAILDVGALARAAAGPGARLSAFVLGLNDLAFETRARQTPDRAPMTAWMSAAVAAARAFGLEVFDGVSNRLNDPEGFRRECAQGRDFGMDGKTLIHPDQIAICNEVFAPTFEEVEDARAVLAAFAAPEAIGRGALRVGGRMVERLHAEAAERTLRIAAVIDRRRG
jgi:citrate lyase subunit beta/citryl-CoA lyase